MKPGVASCAFRNICLPRQQTEGFHSRRFCAVKIVHSGRIGLHGQWSDAVRPRIITNFSDVTSELRPQSAIKETRRAGRRQPNVYVINQRVPTPLAPRNIGLTVSFPPPLVVGAADRGRHLIGQSTPLSSVAIRLSNQHRAKVKMDDLEEWVSNWGPHCIMSLETVSPVSFQSVERWPIGEARSVQGKTVLQRPCKPPTFRLQPQNN